MFVSIDIFKACLGRSTLLFDCLVYYLKYFFEKSHTYVIEARPEEILCHMFQPKYEPSHEESGFLPMRKQRHRSAVQ